MVLLITCVLPACKKITVIVRGVMNTIMRMQVMTRWTVSAAQAVLRRITTFVTSVGNMYITMT